MVAAPYSAENRHVKLQGPPIVYEVACNENSGGALRQPRGLQGAHRPSLMERMISSRSSCELRAALQATSGYTVASDGKFVE